MNIAVDLDVKHLIKQTNKVRFNERAHYVINIFLLSAISLSYHVIPMAKSHYARCSFLYMHNCTIIL